MKSIRLVAFILLFTVSISCAEVEDDVQGIEVDVAGKQKVVNYGDPHEVMPEDAPEEDESKDEEELRLLEELIKLKQQELELRKKQKGKAKKGHSDATPSIPRTSSQKAAPSVQKPKQVQKPPSSAAQSSRGKRPSQRKNVALMTEADLSAEDDGDGDYLVPAGIHEGPSLVTAAVPMLANAREGLSEWIAAGDEEGTLRIINKDGSVAASFEEPEAGAVKYILSGPKNEAYVVTFHADGRLRMYRIHKNRVPKAKGSAKNLEQVLAPVTVERTHKSDAITDADGNVGSIAGLDVIYASAKTYFIVAESNGNISFFNKQLELQNSMNIHRDIRTLKRGTNSIAVGSGDTITILNSKNMNIQNEECRLPDLVAEGSTIVSLEYDKARPMVIYAGTSNGEVVTFDASSKNSKKAQCRVLGDVMDLGEIQPVALSAISGYVMATAANTMTVFNVTGVSRWGVRPCWRRDLGLELATGENSVVVTNRQLSVMVLGGKSVSIYKSKFPNKNPWDDIMKWKAPLFLLGGALVIGWQYYRYKKKKDDLERKKIEKQSMDRDTPSFRRSAPADDPYARYNESNNYGRASDYGRGVGSRYGDSARPGGGRFGGGGAGMGMNYRQASTPAATYSDDDNYDSDE